MKITHNQKDTYFTEKGVNYFNADREIGKKWYSIELWSKKTINDELYLMVGQRHENVVRDLGRYGEK